MLFYGIYAVTKYQLRTQFAPTMLISVGAIVGLIRVGLWSSNGEINAYNRQVYDKYKDEVQNPKYRGIKLHNNKKAY